MNNFEFNLSCDPKDDYEKAKKDLIQAMISFQRLNNLQQEQLVRELFGLGAVVQIKKIMNSRFY